MIYQAYLWPMLSKWNSSVHMSKLSFWIYILSFIMVVEFLKLDHPKWRYAHLTVMVLKSTKWRDRFSKFGVYNWADVQLGEKSSKLNFEFDLNISHYIEKQLWFCKMQKSQPPPEKKKIKKSLTDIFSHISAQNWAQKCLILIEWVTLVTKKSLNTTCLISCTKIITC